MRSLLYRDWILIRKTRAIFFSLFYLFFLIPEKNNSFMLNYSTNFIFVLITYLFFSYLTAYDYKYNGLAFTSAFPVSKKDIVVSRYVFIAMAFTVYLAIIIAIKAIISYIQGSGLVMDFRQTSIYILVFSIFFSIIIPLYYKLGYQKIRWIMFAAMFAAAVLSGILQQSGFAFDSLLFFIASLITGSILYCFSMEISCRILVQKDL